MSKHVTFMTIDDAEHYSPEKRAEIIAAYPEHEREARARGIPILGSGRVFPIAEELITEDAFPVPIYWPRIIGVDFGWDHPFAAADLAHDTESDVVHVVNVYRKTQASPAMHAIALKPWGLWKPVAWPMDGRNETLAGAGVALAKQFTEHGMNMLGTHAQFTDGSKSVEAGVMDMIDRMQTARFKVFRHLNDFFEEYRLYHRKDGLIVKLKDDVISAVRYGMMMLRKAECEPRLFKPRGAARVSDPLGDFR